MTLNSNYFQAIQTAVFYKKSVTFHVSRPKMKVQEKLSAESGLRYLIGWIILASKFAKDCEQFHVFGTFC